MASSLIQDFSQIMAAPPFAAAVAGINDLAVAVSGGPDSMALGHLVARWAGDQGINIHLLTVDHGLRAGSAEEAEKVRQWVATWPNTRHAILKAGEIDETSRVMEQARNQRYRLMSSYCAKHHISALSLAHHQNDQAETFLFRLAKGSGLDGLGAMRPVQLLDEGRGKGAVALKLLRPLLGWEKTELIAYCDKENISYIHDPTNEKTDYARNRIRHAREVLEREGLTAQRLSLTAARLSRAREALDFYADDLFTQVIAEKTDDAIMLVFDKLAAAPEEMRLRVILKALADIDNIHGKSGGYGPRLNKMEALVAGLFDQKRSFRRQTLGGYIFSRNLKSNRLRLEKESQN